MQYERIEMFADLAIREAMKNIFASPPFGGGGTAPKGVSKSLAIGDAGRLDALKTKARRHGAKRSNGE